MLAGLSERTQGLLAEPLLLQPQAKPLLPLFRNNYQVQELLELEQPLILERLQMRPSGLEGLHR